jgi:hypothetical protein
MAGTAEQKRAHYRRNRHQILAQQRAYRRTQRPKPKVKVRNRRLSRAWHRRFQAAMLAAGYPGSGQGLSATGYRYRESRGLAVPPWPQLLDPKKARRGTSASVQATKKNQTASRRLS